MITATGTFYSAFGDFPYNVRNQINAYNSGSMSLSDTLEAIGQHYHSSISEYFTYDTAGHKIPRTTISFGIPHVIHFVFD